VSTPRQKLASVTKTLGLAPGAPVGDVVAALEAVLESLDIEVSPADEMTMLSRSDPKEYHRRLTHQAMRGR
jgi:hypothetical protein